jgi:hypothetical protein
MSKLRPHLLRLFGAIWLLLLSANPFTSAPVLGTPSDGSPCLSSGRLTTASTSCRYDVCESARFGYDNRAKLISADYVATSVLPSGQGRNALAGERTLFTKFAGFLAAEGTTATQLEFDFAKGLGPAPKPVYPPNNGFLGSSGSATLVPGTTIDRFGSDFGRFAAPEGTPFIQRSLPSSSASAPYSVFQVAKPFEVQAGQAAPWFGMPGLGVQYQLPSTVNELINGGFLLRVNP